MKQRIIGFDLARAYAILGMYIVNFNTVYGSYSDQTVIGKFLILFSGNSSSMFVILAGMGIALMTNRSEYTVAQKLEIKKTISLRSWFLFTLGLLLYLWWPADILHFYGGYMHLSLMILFLPKKYFLWAALFAILIFHLLLMVVPYETGWNFETLEYSGFWTINGFLRNTFYNGWNPIFPWVAYFFVGMWLGKLDWASFYIQKRMFGIGFFSLIIMVVLHIYANMALTNEDLIFYITADYIPPFLPFMISTTGFAMMCISLFMFIGGRFKQNKFATALAATGQMTLTHYLSHLTIGMIVFSAISGKKYSGQLSEHAAVSPLFILIFSLIYFAISCLFSNWWIRKNKNGPVEWIMRKISG